MKLNRKQELSLWGAWVALTTGLAWHAGAFSSVIAEYYQQSGLEIFLSARLHRDFSIPLFTVPLLMLVALVALRLRSE